MTMASQTRQSQRGGLADALMSLRIEINNNRQTMERIAALIKVQEERARAIEATINSDDAALEIDKTRLEIVDKPEPLYALVVKIARKYAIATGRPVNRHDIIYWSGIEGCRLDVTNPEKFVSKNIWMSKAFVSFEEGYWPADLPDPAGVTPNRRHGKRRA
ncbi:hypothetical protein [Rhizobium leguminosarum]|uniref:hypothetical protein n=1 Tax=Rhizobium leguminosarum TaxID=384 RepID=UPI0015F825DF|nr:hypothetical protein [Rhizobium leguminosarum]MBA9030936.1 hypothetical protein [Rhizobium leguminosarum]